MMKKEKQITKTAATHIGITIIIFAILMIVLSFSSTTLNPINWDSNLRIGYIGCCLAVAILQHSRYKNKLRLAETVEVSNLTAVQAVQLEHKESAIKILDERYKEIMKPFPLRGELSQLVENKISQTKPKDYERAEH